MRIKALKILYLTYLRKIIFYNFFFCHIASICSLINHYILGIFKRVEIPIPQCHHTDQRYARAFFFHICVSIDVDPAMRKSLPPAAQRARSSSLFFPCSFITPASCLVGIVKPVNCTAQQRLK